MWNVKEASACPQAALLLREEGEGEGEARESHRVHSVPMSLNQYLTDIRKLQSQLKHYEETERGNVTCDMGHGIGVHTNTRLRNFLNQLQSGQTQLKEIEMELMDQGICSESHWVPSQVMNDIYI